MAVHPLEDGDWDKVILCLLITSTVLSVANSVLQSASDVTDLNIWYFLSIKDACESLSTTVLLCNTVDHSNFQRNNPYAIAVGQR